MSTLELYQDRLPVLEAMIEALPIKELPNLQKVAFVCVQHLLYTTINLMESFVRLGVRPDNIHIMGKSYSSCPEVAERLKSNGYHYHLNTQQQKLGQFADYFYQDINHMWEKAYQDLQQKDIDLILILDDGGLCLTTVPDYISKTYPLVGVEQTTSGLSNLLLRELDFPIVEVASSAAKQLVEPPMIAEAVIQKLEAILPVYEKNLPCAVVGMGSIGRAITQKLLSLNHKVMIYDKDFEKVKAFKGAIPFTNIESLLYEADYIFGCSGKDITQNLDMRSLNTNKTFISCSSQDKEFLTLLNIFEQNNLPCLDALDHLECELNNQSIKIFRGGFPINLDNSGESVAALDIQLTRGLLLGGVLQSILNPTQKKVCYMLHPALQSFVVSHWRSYGSTFLFAPHFLELFQNLSWIEEKSRGTYEKNAFLEKIFYYESAHTQELLTYGREILSKRYAS